MTTATRQKPAAPSVELRKLERARDAAHVKAREAKAKRNAWDGETVALQSEYGEHARLHPEEFEGAERRAKPGTTGAKLSANIKERLEQPNPHEPAYGAARDEFHRHDERVNAFRTQNFVALVQEHDPLHAEAEETIRAGFAEVERGCEIYEAGRDAVLGEILAALPRKAQDLIVDDRVREWAELAAEVRTTEIVAPHSLTIKLGQHHE